MLQPFGVALVWVMRGIQSKVHEEGFILVLLDEFPGLGGHQFGEEISIFENLLAVAPEVVTVGTVPVKKVRVVVNAATHVAEGMIEALRVGHRLGRVAEVPFADVRGGIAGGLEGLGDGYLAGGHADTAFLAGHISGHPGAHGITAGQHPRARGRTHRRGGVELREAHIALGE